jgi:WD40 repeat protein
VQITEQEAFDFAQQVLRNVQLNTVQEVVFRAAWSGRSYIQMANAHDYDYGYVKDIGSRLWQILSEALDEKVKKQNLKAVVAKHYSQQPPVDRPPSNHRHHWGEAIDVSTFYGRTTELNTLHHWVMQDRCRLVAILGMGGIGKTSLAIKFAQQQSDSFDCLIWRSLLNAPLLADLLTELLHHLSPRSIAQPFQNIPAQISELLSLLQQQRCLVILDNLESVLEQGTAVGTYLPGYENYRTLLQKLTEIQHQSCVILTSREKPPEIARQEGIATAVRSLPLGGLALPAGQAIFADRGFQVADHQEIAAVLAHYGGNPLALKIVAASIQEMLGGELQSWLPYLQTGKLQFTDINDVLHSQLTRTTLAEQIVLYWLTINRVPIAIETLATDIYPGQVMHQPQLLLAMQSLKRRSLIEQAGSKWFLQPVVMEFITAHLITHITDEIIASQPNILYQIALVKSHSQNYVRQAQMRLVLQPIAALLSQKMAAPQKGSSPAIHSLLQQLQQSDQPFAAYAPGNLLNLLKILESDLKYLDCSALPIWQADLIGSMLHHSNFSNTTFQDCLFTQPFSAVLNVAFSPDGQLLAASNASGEIQLWQTHDSQCHQTLSGHQNWVRIIAFSPDSRLLASTSDDLTIRIWDTHTGTCTKTIQSSSFPLHTSFCPTGQQLVTAHADGHLKIWEVATWQLRQELVAHQGWACRATFSPDGEQLVSSGADNLVKLWDLATGHCIQEMSGHDGWIFTAIFSPDGHQILSAALDRTMRIWDRHTGVCLKILTGHTGWIWSAVFSPDGQQIASTSDDRTLRLWHPNSGQCQQVIQGHTDQIWSVAYHPAGDRLATGSEDQTIRLWDPQDGKCLQVIQGWLNWVLAIAIQPQGQYLASGHNNHVVRIWHIAQQKCTQELPGHQQRVRTVAFHPSLPIVVSGSDDTTMKAWPVASHSTACNYTMSGHQASISAVKFSPTGQLLASASSDTTIRLWHPTQNECLACLSGHQDKVRDVDFSACGQYLVSVSEDQTAKVWDMQTEQCIYTFTGHTDRLIAGSFHPDGQHIASAGQDNSIKIWNFRTGELVLNISYPSGWVLALSYSACGQWLVNGGNDRQVCVWDAVTGVCLQSMTKHTNWVWDVAINPIDQSIVSASADETICFWEWQTDQPVKSLQVERPYENMNITAVQGLTPAQKDNLKKLGAIELPDFSHPDHSKLLPINFRPQKGRLAN